MDQLANETSKKAYEHPSLDKCERLADVVEGVPPITTTGKLMG